MRTLRRGRPFFLAGDLRPLLRVGFFLRPGDAHALRALAAAGVGLGALAAHGQAAAVAQAAVGADLGQALDVLRALAAEVAFDLARLDRVAKLDRLVLGEVLDVGVRVDSALARISFAVERPTPWT